VPLASVVAGVRFADAMQRCRTEPAVARELKPERDRVGVRHRQLRPGSAGRPCARARGARRARRPGHPARRACSSAASPSAPARLPRLVRRPPSRTAGVATWAERGRRACAAGGAGRPSYTTSLRTPAASTAPPRHAAALATLTVTDALEPPPPPPGQDGRARHREALCCEQRQRWRSPDPRAHGRSIADAVPSTTQGAALHDHAVREVLEGSPHGAADRWPDYAALISPRSWSAYCQPICNEPASSRQPTAKRPATKRAFPCHGLHSVTRRVQRIVNG
jgi:hypothetical protein